MIIMMGLNFEALNRRGVILSSGYMGESESDFVATKWLLWIGLSWTVFNAILRITYYSFISTYYIL